MMGSFNFSSLCAETCSSLHLTDIGIYQVPQKINFVRLGRIGVPFLEGIEMMFKESLGTGNCYCLV